MTQMFDPYRRLTITYKPDPKDQTMDEAHEDLEPLRLQLETTLTIMNTARAAIRKEDLWVLIPARHWHKLDIALADLETCARNLL